MGRDRTGQDETEKTSQDNYKRPFISLVTSVSVHNGIYALKKDGTRQDKIGQDKTRRKRQVQSRQYSSLQDGVYTFGKDNTRRDRTGQNKRKKTSLITRIQFTSGWHLNTRQKQQ